MLAEYIYLGDQLLSMIKPGELAYYFHNDHLGTPQVLTDDSQVIAWKAVYTPFGGAVPSIQTVENPFRFPGQYYDPETGLHYNYFRYYNPQTGRYITPDPIGLEGGINLFVYVQNKPLNKSDRLGLWFDSMNAVNWQDPPEAWGTIDLQLSVTFLPVNIAWDFGKNLSVNANLPGLSVGFGLDMYYNQPRPCEKYVQPWIGPGKNLSIGTNVVYEGELGNKDKRLSVLGVQGFNLSFGWSAGIPFGVQVPNGFAR
jgi:RHS repeat-associated protein